MIDGDDGIIDVDDDLGPSRNPLMVMVSVNPGVARRGGGDSLILCSSTSPWLLMMMVPTLLCCHNCIN